jgi:hypothetical protein
MPSHRKANCTRQRHLPRFQPATLITATQKPHFD